MAKIVILGGGFAAVAAAEQLAASSHDITLVALGRQFTFYPALVPLVFAGFQPSDIQFDLAEKLGERRIRFVEGRATAIDPQARTVAVTGSDIDGVLHYDRLLIALGRRLAFEEVPGLAENAHHLLGVDAAIRFREAIEKFESGAIVVGMCAGASLPIPVCEAAFALANRFRSEIEAGTVNVTAVFPATPERAFAGAALFRGLGSEFERLNIRVVTDFAVDHAGEAAIVSTRGALLDHDLLMLVPPFRGQALLRELAPAANGFAPVNELLQFRGASGVYAAGDIVSLPGPRFGYMAMRQGRVAAANILAELSGREPTAEYSHKIEWAISEKYTDPVFFHYGFWDETLEDHDENAFFGMARPLRDLYGRMKSALPQHSIAKGN